MEPKSTRYKRNPKTSPSRGIPKCPSETVRLCQSDNIKYFEVEINLSKNLKKYITGRNISQSDLAKITGLQQSTINNYIHGSIPKGLKNILIIARRIEVSLDELILNSVN